MPLLGLSLGMPFRDVCLNRSVRISVFWNAFLGCLSFKMSRPESTFWYVCLLRSVTIVCLPKEDVCHLGGPAPKTVCLVRCLSFRDVCLLRCLSFRIALFSNVCLLEYLASRISVLGIILNDDLSFRMSVFYDVCLLGCLSFKMSVF
ncbi:hypothetical protein FOCC_FOCC015656 [Frankliniella occidentalis]|nr:hypothetical protein FOCC_FOCC015656 [Frankliniella occidentalis]